MGEFSKQQGISPVASRENQAWHIKISAEKEEQKNWVLKYHKINSCQITWTTKKLIGHCLKKSTNFLQNFHFLHNSVQLTILSLWRAKFASMKEFIHFWLIGKDHGNEAGGNWKVRRDAKKPRSATEGFQGRWEYSKNLEVRLTAPNVLGTRPKHYDDQLDDGSKCLCGRRKKVRGQLGWPCQTRWDRA